MRSLAVQPLRRGLMDLNSPAAIQLDGVLFMDRSEARCPRMINHLIRDLRTAAQTNARRRVACGCDQASWDNGHDPRTEMTTSRWCSVNGTAHANDGRRPTSTMR